MSYQTAVALIGFAFVMAVSPGPANFLLLVSGANFGFARSLPLVLGIIAGLQSMVFLVGIGLGEVLERFPLVYTTLRFVSCAYVLWLAYKVARSRSLGGPEDDALAKPISFFQAALLQWVNPKAWAVALIVAVAYTDPARYLLSLWVLIAIFALVAFPSLSVWALGGMAVRRLLSQPKWIIAFNIGMAVLLVASTLPVVFAGHN